MYHYVRKFEKNFPNFRFLHVDDFKKQLNFFEKEYGFVSKEEWHSYIKGNGMGSGKGKVILTFDDGLNCHYDYVYPELVKRNLWGIFYVATRSLIDFKLINTHKIHLLCGAFEGKKLLNCLTKLLTDEMILDSKRKEFKNNTYTKQKNYAGVTEFKRILNYFVSSKYIEPLIDGISSQLNYTINGDNFYITLENLIKMKQNDMLIGSHTVDHDLMSRLTSDEQSAQISQSFKILEKVISNTHKTYCHPYGGFHSFDENTINLLSMANVAYSFNVESRDIEEDDIIKSRHSLPRFDCNEFSHGQAT